MAEYLIIFLFILGTWGMVKKDNLIKKIISLNIFNSSIVILFVYIGSHTGSTAPIMLEGVKDIVDPLPQALMLTAIVIGISLTALALSFVLKIYRIYGTLSIYNLQKRLKPDDE